MNMVLTCHTGNKGLYDSPVVFVVFVVSCDDIKAPRSGKGVCGVSPHISKNKIFIDLIMSFMILL